MRHSNLVSDCLSLGRGVAVALFCSAPSASTLSAQTRADSLDIMRALGDYVRQAAAPGLVGLRAGFDSRIMPGVQGRLSLGGLVGPAAEPMIGALRARAGARVRALPVPRRAVDDAAAQREAAYPSTFAFGGLRIGTDSAFATVTRTFHHVPRPSTFTAGEYVLTLVRKPSGQWYLVSDSLLTVSDGYHDFAPLENLPADIRTLEKARRRPPR